MSETRLVNLRVDENVKDEWQAAADDAGLSLSEFIRGTVNERVGREALVSGKAVPAPPVARVAEGPACLPPLGQL